MKNLAKFLLFVLLLSAGISLLYDYRLKHRGLDLHPARKPEKYTLASAPSVDPKQVPSLEAFSRKRRELVKSVIPSVVAVKTSKRVGIRREYGLDPFDFFFGKRDRRGVARRGRCHRSRYLRLRCHGKSPNSIPSSAGDGRHNAHRISVTHWRLILLRVSNIFIIYVDVHEAPKSPIVGIQMLFQVRIFLGQTFQGFPHGRRRHLHAVDRHRQFQ